MSIQNRSEQACKLWQFSSKTLMFTTSSTIAGFIAFLYNSQPYGWIAVLNFTLMLTVAVASLFATFFIFIYKKNSKKDCVEYSNEEISEFFNKIIDLNIETLDSELAAVSALETMRTTDESFIPKTIAFINSANVIRNSLKFLMKLLSAEQGEGHTSSNQLQLALVMTSLPISLLMLGKEYAVWSIPHRQAENHRYLQLLYRLYTQYLQMFNNSTTADAPLILGPRISQHFEHLMQSIFDNGHLKDVAHANIMPLSIRQKLNIMRGLCDAMYETKRAFTDKVIFVIGMSLSMVFSILRYVVLPLIESKNMVDTYIMITYITLAAAYIAVITASSRTFCKKKSDGIVELTYALIAAEHNKFHILDHIIRRKYYARLFTQETKAKYDKLGEYYKIRVLIVLIKDHNKDLLSEARPLELFAVALGLTLSCLQGVRIMQYGTTLAFGMGGAVISGAMLLLVVSVIMRIIVRQKNHEYRQSQLSSMIDYILYDNQKTACQPIKVVDDPPDKIKAAVVHLIRLDVVQSVVFSLGYCAIFFLNYSLVRIVYSESRLEICLGLVSAVFFITHCVCTVYRNYWQYTNAINNHIDHIERLLVENRLNLDVAGDTANTTSLQLIHAEGLDNCEEEALELDI